MAGLLPRNGNPSGARLQQSLQKNVQQLQQIQIFKDVSTIILAKTKLAAVWIIGPLGYASQGYLVTESDEVYVVGEKWLQDSSDSATEEHITRYRKDLELSGLGIQEFGFSHDIFVRTTSGVLYCARNKELEEDRTNTTGNPYVFPPDKVATAGEYITKIACGETYALYITLSGKVFSSGDNEHGEPGRGDSFGADDSFSQVTFPAGIEIIDVVCTSFSSFAITKDGQVFAWGSNKYGQLGDGTRTDRFLPRLITFPDDTAISKIGCVHEHSIALGREGSLFVWGWNEHGQLGIGSKTAVLSPTRLTLPDKVIDIPPYLPSYISACRTKDKLYVWGLLEGKKVLVPDESHFETFHDFFTSINKLRIWRRAEREPELIFDLKSLAKNPRNQNIWFQLEGEIIIPGCKFLLERWQILTSRFGNEWTSCSMENPIIILDAREQGFRMLIHYAHSDELETEEIEDESIIHLLELSVRYGITPLVRAVVAILDDRLCHENVVEIYKAACSCDAQDLWIDTLVMMKPAFAEIMIEQEDTTIASRIVDDFKLLKTILE